jgi:hypothetical protein
MDPVTEVTTRVDRKQPDADGRARRGPTIRILLYLRRDQSDDPTLFYDGTGDKLLGKGWS